MARPVLKAPLPICCCEAGVRASGRWDRRRARSCYRVRPLWRCPARRTPCWRGSRIGWRPAASACSSGPTLWPCDRPSRTPPCPRGWTSRKWPLFWSRLKIPNEHYEPTIEWSIAYSECPWKTDTEWMGSRKSHRRNVVSLDAVTTSLWLGCPEACVSSWSWPFGQRRVIESTIKR